MLDEDQYSFKVIMNKFASLPYMHLVHFQDSYILQRRTLYYHLYFYISVYCKNNRSGCKTKRCSKRNKRNDCGMVQNDID